MSSTHSAEELTDILRRALEAFDNDCYGHVFRRSGEPWHLARDIERLNACCPDSEIEEEGDYWGVIVDCLESALGNPLQTYKPPE